ncbi:ABC transporter substrate-binding protein, partial [bacterium]|nr:ABC transporter substrate-binding protein [bacterium]
EKDYALYISKCLNSGADAVYAVVAGSDSVTFLKQADGVKLKEKMDIFGPVLLSLLSVKAVGNAAVGVYTGVRYSFTYDCPANKAFVESYKKEYGTIPNMFAGEAYDGVKMFIKAIEKSGSMDKEKWINSLEGFKYTESVEGIKVMRKCDHQALQIGLFAEIVKSSDFPDPYPKVIKVFPPEKVHRPCGKEYWW